MLNDSSVQHVFIVGSKGIPGNYGGYETFVDKLTEYHQNNPNLKYHVACKAKDTKTFEYHNADCFDVKVPSIGPAQAIYYDVAALNQCVRYIKRHNIQHPIVYILACRIGPFAAHFQRVIHKLGGKALFDLFDRNIGAGLDTQKILVVFSATGEVCQPTAGFACASQLLQSVYQLLVSRDHLLCDQLVMEGKEMVLLLFCQLPEGFQALGEKLIHVVGIGVTDKRTALSQNTIQGGITHKEASLGFFFFKLENTMEVSPDGAQKLQVIGQISGGVKGIFSQQDRKLSLDSQTWPQRFLQYVIFS